jgi:hypothetical protein
VVYSEEARVHHDTSGIVVMKCSRRAGTGSGRRRRRVLICRGREKSMVQLTRIIYKERYIQRRGRVSWRR